MAFGICGILYSCSVPIRGESHSFLAKVGETGQPPYPLDSTDPADAEKTLAAAKGNAGFWTFNFHDRGGSNTTTRACLFGRLSLPSGGRWMEIALEDTSQGWRVRDLSFDRECKSGKRGDFKLH